MGLRKYVRKEFACIKDDLGVTLDYVKMPRDKGFFTYKEKSYNIVRDEAYNIKLVGLIFTKVIYFYNINNSNPLHFNKDTSQLEPIISPELYNRMLENEILIKLNTLSNGINYKKILIIAGIALLAYFAWQSGIFGNHVTSTVASNISNSTNYTEIPSNFTKIATNTSNIIRTTAVNISPMVRVQ